MIKSEVELRPTIDVIGNMYHALADLHRRVAPLDLRNYQILAEGPIEEIRRAQNEINEYLGVADQFAAETERA